MSLLNEEMSRYYLMDGKKTVRFTQANKLPKNYPMLAEIGGGYSIMRELRMGRPIIKRY